MSIFTDKVAIITGGASGIGCAIGQQMAKEGAIVILADVNKEQAEKVAEEIKKNGGRAFPYEIDVRYADQIGQLVEKTVADHGCLDYMFNNAGIGIWGEMGDMSIEQWDRLFDINVRGVIYGIHHAFNVMRKQGHGHIINTASLAGLLPVPTLGAYAGTKHTVVGLSQSFRIEAKHSGVKVSVVCPGFVDTPIKDAMEITKNRSKEDAKNDVNVKFCPVDKAVRTILKGVKRNKRMIIVTFYAHLMSRMYRYFPRTCNFMLQKFYKKS